MSEWKEYKLGDVADILSSKRVFYSDYVSTGIPFFRSKEIIELSLRENMGEPLYISEKKYLEFKEQNGSPQDGDVLISAVGERAGIPYVVDGLGDFYFKDGNIIWLRKIKPTLNSHYFYYWIKSSVGLQTIENIMIGSAQKALTIIGLKNLMVLLPSPEYQKLIVDTLKSFDDKLDLLHRQNKTLEELAETLFRQWFVEEVEDSWAETSLHAQTEVFRGLSYKGSGLAEEGNGIPMHNLNSVYEGGGYKLDGIKFYNGEYRDRHVIKPGEIIVTNTEQGHEHKLIGFPAIVPDYYGDLGLFSQHIYKLKTLPESYLSNEFLYYLLMTHYMREQIIGATNGSTVNMLATDGLQRPEFKLPPKEKVIEYTEIVKNYWKKKNSNNKQIRTLTGLRDTLLPKLMSGEIKVRH